MRKVLTREAKFIITGSIVWWLVFAILFPYTIYEWQKHANSQEKCEFYGHQCDAGHGVNSLYFKTEYNVYTFNVTVPLGCQMCCDTYLPFGKYQNGFCIINDGEMVDYSERGRYEIYLIGVITLICFGIPVWLLVLLLSPCNYWRHKNTFQNIYRDAEHPMTLN